MILPDNLSGRHSKRVSDMSKMSMTEVRCAAMNWIQVTLEVMWGRRIFFNCHTQTIEVERFNSVLFKKIQGTFSFDAPCPDGDSAGPHKFEASDLRLVRSGHRPHVWSLSLGCRIKIEEHPPYRIDFDVKLVQGMGWLTSISVCREGKEMVKGHSLSERQVLTLPDYPEYIFA